MRIAVAALCVLLLGTSAGAAQFPPCPGTSQQSYSGHARHGGPGVTFSVGLHPCETVTYTLTATTTAPRPVDGLVRGYGSTGQQLFWAGFVVEPQRPKVVIVTHHGVRGAEGRPVRLVVSSGGLDFSFTITAARTPRPGYNVGGSDFAGALAVAGATPRAIGNLSYVEPGQFFRVRLAPGGTLRVTGTCEGDPAYGSYFGATLYDATGKKVVSGFINSACYGRASFSSALYRNKTNTTQDVYLNIWCKYHLLRAFVMDFQITGGQPCEVTITTPEQTLQRKGTATLVTAAGPATGTYTWTSDRSDVVTFKGSRAGRKADRATIQALASGATRVRVRLTCDGGGSDEDDLKVLVASPDVTVVGWVDATKPAAALRALTNHVNILLFYQLEGSEAHLTCPALLTSWLVTGVPLYVVSDVDRRYVNVFMLARSANDKPSSTIDPAEVAAARDYRLLNRFQVAYDPEGPSVRYLRQTTDVGPTPNPCVIGPLARVLAMDAEEHPEHGIFGSVVGGDGSVFQLSEGRLGTGGQRINSVLNGRTTPWIWSVIRFDSNARLDPVAIDRSMFPTFFLYEDGKLTRTFPPSEAEAFIALDDTYQRLFEDFDAATVLAEDAEEVATVPLNDLLARSEDAALTELRRRFDVLTDTLDRQRIASALVERLEDDLPYWELLVAAATEAVRSGVPFPFAVNRRGRIETGDFAADLLTWAAREGITLDLAGRYALADAPTDVFLMALTNDPRGRDVLLEGLSSPNPLVVYRAAWGLARLGDDSAVPAIVAAADDAPDHAREFIARALLLFLASPEAQAAADRLIEDDQLREAFRAQAETELQMRIGGHGALAATEESDP